MRKSESHQLTEAEKYEKLRMIGEELAALDLIITFMAFTVIGSCIVYAIDTSTAHATIPLGLASWLAECFAKRQYKHLQEEWRSVVRET